LDTFPEFDGTLSLPLPLTKSLTPSNRFAFTCKQGVPGLGTTSFSSARTRN